MEPVKVSIVEDRPDLRKSLTTLLSFCEELSFAGAFASAREALDGIPNIKPDVVLMDLHLVGMDGIECTRRLKTLLPDTKILMLTVEENDDDLILRAIRAGASGYLVKRQAMSKLIDSTLELHRGEVPISPNIARKILAAVRKEDSEQCDGVETLTRQEVKILRLVAEGWRNKEIGRDLSIKTSTVESHLRNIYEKLSVTSRTEAALKFKGWSRRNGPKD
jgi:DNA-binding NarL/FixJ family response regulator